MAEKPWWWPDEINAEWYARKRTDMPEETAGLCDEDVLNNFNEGWTQFSDTWDHLGDAREEYQHLARAFLDLVKETGKSPSDFTD